MASEMQERLKIVQVAEAASYDAGTTYNGAADASGLGIDVSGYNEALIVLNSGTASGTNTVTLVSSNDNSTVPSGWDAITDAEFTAVDSDNDQAIQVARVYVGGDKRYLAAKSVVADAACEFGIIAVLGEPESEPTGANTMVFNV